MGANIGNDGGASETLQGADNKEQSDLARAGDRISSVGAEGTAVPVVSMSYMLPTSKIARQRVWGGSDTNLRSELGHTGSMPLS